MSIVDFAFNYVVVFLIVLTILVFVHEWGHYWIARRCGVRVEVFSIGFGPEIFGWTDKHDTRWKISAIPLGGYVKMFGEADLGWEEEEEAQPLPPEEKAVSFHHKKLWQRSAIVFAGPAANFIFAAALVALLAGIIGTARPLAAVGEVQPGSAAEAAQMLPGDRITAIDGAPIKWFEDLRETVSAKPGVTLRMDVARGDEIVSLTVTPQARSIEGQDTPIGLLGVRFDPQAVEYERQGPIDAVSTGAMYTVQMVTRIFGVLGEMISGHRSAEELGGPLRIAQLSGDIAQLGFKELVMFMAALSVNLGLINLFPIPVLDGGRLMFYAAEGLRGRPVAPKIEEYGMRLGLALVLFLVVFVTWNDITQMPWDRVFTWFKGLI
ncbi:MAG: RIP metalloprotease RseP [Rhodospirillaceae bacterium]|nr:RIP metalloprotease RseP [Magnetovibrio sp.]MAY67502.1 RIP metalloprotease RseP [Rhodospirillaceae bacterium]